MMSIGDATLSPETSLGYGNGCETCEPFECEHSPDREITLREKRYGALASPLYCEDCGAEATMVADVDEYGMTWRLEWED